MAEYGRKCLKAWKLAEKEVAEFFGGMRRVRMSYSERAGDIIHPTLSIEVKYGKCIPKYLRVTEPTLLNYDEDLPRFYLCPSYLLHKDTVFKHVVKRGKFKFMLDAYRQAKNYSDKTAVVCVKGKGMRGFIVIWQSPDYLLHHILNSTQQFSVG